MLLPTLNSISPSPHPCPQLTQEYETGSGWHVQINQKAWQKKCVFRLTLKVGREGEANHRKRQTDRQRQKKRQRERVRMRETAAGKCNVSPHRRSARDRRRTAHTAPCPERPAVTLHGQSAQCSPLGPSSFPAQPQGTGTALLWTSHPQAHLPECSPLTHCVSHVSWTFFDWLPVPYDVKLCPPVASPISGTQ